jgi:hypothetical protein
MTGLTDCPYIPAAGISAAVAAPHPMPCKMARRDNSELRCGLFLFQYPGFGIVFSPRDFGATPPTDVYGFDLNAPASGKGLP